MRYGIVMPRFTQNNNESYVFPIGMAYVASSLKRTGREVVTYNLNYKEGNLKELIGELVCDRELDVLCTGGLTVHYWQMKMILDAAREAKPDIILAVGGGGVLQPRLFR